MNTSQWFDPISAEFNRIERSHGRPERTSGALTFDFSELQRAFEKQNAAPFVELAREIARGVVLVLKNSFSLGEVEFLKSEALRLRSTESSSFHKMLEGVPDYWRDISDPEITKQYSVAHVKKAAYFFPWNSSGSSSPTVFETVYPRWRVLKTLAGLRPDEFEKLTPKDGKVDRLQITEYPPGTGFIAPHQDPDHNQRLIMSGYLSTRGKDYHGGGFWALNQENHKLDLESFIEAGDLGTCMSTLVHGVDSTDASAVPEQGNSEMPAGQAIPGLGGARWWMGLFTNDSDEIAVRGTSVEVSL